jgi:glutaminase
MQPRPGILPEVLDRVRFLRDGELASYIPQLALADPEALGIAAVSMKGNIYQHGDSEVPFTIQSVSKPFIYALAVQHLGVEEMATRVGVEPSGEPFNAISLEEGTGRPMNPMINAGAIVVSSLMDGQTAAEKVESVRTGLAAFAGRHLEIDEAVFASEDEHGDRNRALAHLTHGAGVLGSSVDVATETYFRQCSLIVTARDIAVMSATLANAGRNPVTGEVVVSESTARWTMAVMAGSGMYDASGEWLARVGLPAKSGVSGGIAAVDPGRLGFGVYSPRLDARGNSVRGIAAVETLSREYGLHMFANTEDPFDAFGV